MSFHRCSTTDERVTFGYQAFHESHLFGLNHSISSRDHRPDASLFPSKVAEHNAEHDHPTSPFGSSTKHLISSVPDGQSVSFPESQEQLTVSCPPHLTSTFQHPPQDACEAISACLGSMLPSCISTIASTIMASCNQQCSSNTAGGPPHGVKAVCGKRAKMEDTWSVYTNFYEFPAHMSEAAEGDTLPARLAKHIQEEMTSCCLVKSNDDMDVSNCPHHSFIPAPASTKQFFGSSGSGSGASSMEGALDPLHFFAVYDGHGGCEAANHCSQRLHINLVNAIQKAAANLTAEGLNLHEPAAVFHFNEEVDGGSQDLTMYDTGLLGQTGREQGLLSHKWVETVVDMVEDGASAMHTVAEDGASASHADLMNASSGCSSVPDLMELGSNGMDGVEVPDQELDGVEVPDQELDAGSISKLPLALASNVHLSQVVAPQYYCCLEDGPVVDYDASTHRDDHADMVDTGSRNICMEEQVAACSQKHFQDYKQHVVQQQQMQFNFSPASPLTSTLGGTHPEVPSQESLTEEAFVSWTGPEPGGFGTASISSGGGALEACGAGSSYCSTVVEDALKEAFLKTDEEFSSNTCAAMVGSTAVVAVVGKRRVWVANCGDSRAVLCRSGKAIQLTDDHKPDREDEAERVKKAGGQVLYWNGHRVMGILAMSRAIGDHNLRPYVISDPEVTAVARSPEDDFLLLASDGLWDVLCNQDAVDLAKRCLARAWEKGASRKAAARIAASVLTKAAIDKGSRDNVTVVLVDLKTPPSFAPAAADLPAAAQEDNKPLQVQQQQQQPTRSLPVQQRHQNEEVHAAPVEDSMKNIEHKVITTSAPSCVPNVQGPCFLPPTLVCMSSMSVNVIPEKRNALMPNTMSVGGEVSES
ncbi:hypothetical protein CEUSTIGMA_g9587.t1 [Chlamydomonas eustigma]|uniref:protein-serine/threonine phosphatase n=1 Tax=Chlamydomonas eustigma TaxID=1157962 RepID=A0A250XGX0_9CHLO|nr:hypothetical protein CEUSTIGMA_g9587.t1 [Chlamydomonas eustigma]|eukprot:GAX82159.1 hypothetical protein CEUSTIGMA_g9587.t1 [Chlamydomonas eustigma]